MEIIGVMRRTHMNNIRIIHADCLIWVGFLCFVVECFPRLLMTNEQEGVFPFHAHTYLEYTKHHPNTNRVAVEIERPVTLL